MRPVDKSLYIGNQPTYNPYGNAKDDLIKAIGPFAAIVNEKDIALH